MTRHDNHLSCDGAGCPATVALDLHGDATRSAMITATERGWDWYTLDKPHTRHFCLGHRAQCDNERREVEEGLADRLPLKAKRPPNERAIGSGHTRPGEVAADYSV